MIINGHNWKFRLVSVSRLEELARQIHVAGLLGTLPKLPYFQRAPRVSLNALAHSYFRIYKTMVFQQKPLAYAFYPLQQSRIARERYYVLYRQSIDGTSFTYPIIRSPETFIVARGCDMGHGFQEYWSVEAALRKRSKISLAARQVLSRLNVRLHEVELRDAMSTYINSFIQLKEELENEFAIKAWEKTVTDSDDVVWRDNRWGATGQEPEISTAKLISILGKTWLLEHGFKTAADYFRFV